MVAATAGVATVLFSSLLFNHQADMRLQPNSGTLVVDETLVVQVVVEAATPVNVFKGLLTFDPARLVIERIDYNTSIADLWAERPWYSNGAGTLNFIGGTTKPGGFTGTDTLITVTFRARQPGDAKITFADVRILKHDGLGSDANVATPIDSLFTVETVTPEDMTVLNKPTTIESVVVLPEAINTDLNGDGKLSFTDQSIFMVHLASQNPRSDFNKNGSVGIDDLSIMLNTE